MISITAFTINRRPILEESAQANFDVERSPIFGFARYEIILTTDIPFPGAIPNITLSCKPAFFLTPAGGSGSTNNRGFDFNIPAATLPLTVFNAAWAGNQREQNWSSKLTVKTFGGFYILEVVVEAQNTCDLKAYISQTFLSNNIGRALRNTNGAATDLTNATGSAYNTPARAGFDFYLTEITNPVSAPVNQFVPLDLQNFWYDNIAQAITVNGTFQTNLYTRQPNAIEVEYTQAQFTAAGFAFENPVAFLIRTNGVSNATTSDYAQGYDVSAKKIFNPNPVAYPGLSSQYWDFYDQNDKIKLTGGTNWIGAGVTRTFQFEIDETLLTVGERYRLIFLYQFYHAGTNKTYHYTVITDELRVVDTLPDAIPTPTPQIDIYFNSYATQGLTLSPKQRVVNRLFFDGAPYNAVRGAGQFAARIKKLSVRLYSVEITGAATLEHTYTQVQIIRNAANVFIPSAGLEASVDTVNQTIDIAYSHRLRYEQTLVNLYSRRLLPLPVQLLPSPSSNMDMSGRTVYVEFILELINPDIPTDVDQYTYTEVLEVTGYDTTVITFDIQDALGNPIKQLCTSDPTICVQSVGGGVEPAIALLDKEVFSIGNIKEFDGGVSGALPPLTQLQQSPIVTSPANFVANIHKACMDALLLQVGKQYQYCVVTRKDTPFPCYAPFNQSDPDYLALLGRMAAAAPTNLPTAMRQQIIAGTINALKTAGLWNKIDCLWLPACHDSNVALLNWKQNAFNLVPYNGIQATFITDRGFDSPHYQSPRKFFDTQFKPATDGVAYTAAGSHFSVISGNNYEPLGYFVGGNPQAHFLLIQNDGNTVLLIDGGIFSAEALLITSQASSQTTVSRDGNDFYAYNNGDLQLPTGTQASVSLATGCIILHGYNVVPSTCNPANATNEINSEDCSSPEVDGDRFIPFTSLGGYLIDAEVKSLHCIVRCYLEAIGFEYTLSCLLNHWNDPTYC